MSPRDVATHMDLDAEFYRALAREARMNPRPEQYGDRAQTYAEGLAARYELLAEYAAYEASRQRAEVGV